MFSVLKSLMPHHKRVMLNFVAYIVALHGLFLLATSLYYEIHVRDSFHLDQTLIYAPLLFGLTLLYLSTLLRRYKRTAWGVAILVYTFMLGVNVAQLVEHRHHVAGVMGVLRLLVLPLLIVLVLALYHRDFNTKSDIRSFHAAIRFAAAILLATFIYGTSGFMLMDNHDFHEEISFPEAMHRTIDQLNITTTHALKPYTLRARLFVDSLSFVSIGALAYAAVSFFQPLRARFGEHIANDRAAAAQLLESHGGSSEDFFKLWPEDKNYFFNEKGSSFIAYKAAHGVALIVGDPAGGPERAKQAFQAFDELCLTNDWLPAFIHTEPEWNKFYKQQGFALQKIGEEAVVDISKFIETTSRNKYFRNIRNRFEKLGYTAEVLEPPHSQALLERLKEISDDWLRRPGRVERGFAMGYFTKEYMQRCRFVIARDQAGTIKAFLNQVPSFDSREANFDLLRYGQRAPGNINDFVLISFLEYLHVSTDYERLNLGLCPLSGLDELSNERSVVNSILRFAYSNGDRFYSFSGLRRFKSKYEPEWSNRYIAYRGGVRGVTKVANALVRAMRVK